MTNHTSLPQTLTIDEWRREINGIIGTQTKLIDGIVTQAGVVQAELIALRAAVQLLLEQSPHIAKIAAAYLDTMDSFSDQMSPQAVEACRTAYQHQHKLILDALNKQAGTHH